MSGSFQKFAFFCWVFLSGCATTGVNETSRFSVIKTTDIHSRGVIQKPVVADLQVVETKVTATVSVNYGTVAAVKQLDIEKAIAQSNADVLVEPTFKAMVEDDTVTVTVKGFPANYTNFRPIEPDDVELIEAGLAHPVTTNLSQVTANLSQESQESQNPKAMAIALTVVSGVVLMLLLAL